MMTQLQHALGARQDPPVVDTHHIVATTAVNKASVKVSSSMSPHWLVGPKHRLYAGIGQILEQRFGLSADFLSY
ncbi:uncharacterized [Tachysurus ichikawai]